MVRAPPSTFVREEKATYVTQSNMSSERGKAPRAKLNMDHGFMHSIIRNQVDRDEYDKEQKVLKMQNKLGGSSRPKRAAIQMYVPPHLRAKTSNDKQDSSSKVPSTEDWEEEHSVTPTSVVSAPAVRMKLEFVRQDGEVRELNICEGEDLKKVVSSFGRANNLDSRLRDALLHRISSALKERAS